MRKTICKIRQPLREAVHDFGFRVLRRFFNQVTPHLAENGNIYMLYEDIKVSADGKNGVEFICQEHMVVYQISRQEGLKLLC